MLSFGASLKVSLIYWAEFSSDKLLILQLHTSIQQIGCETWSLDMLFLNSGLGWNISVGEVASVQDSEELDILMRATLKCFLEFIFPINKPFAGCSGWSFFFLTNVRKTFLLNSINKSPLN